MSNVQHIFKGAGAPATIPTETGHHYVDISAKKMYFSVGTSSVSDWIILPGASSVAASSVSFTPNGDIGSNNVQTALVEVRDDTDTKLLGKANSVHTHVVADITNFAAGFSAQLATKTTDNLVEGATNLYYTVTRFNTAFGTKTTDTLTEGSTNLYFTGTRAQTAVVQGSLVSSSIKAPSVDAVNTGLAGKANTSHTHVVADITDFASGFTTQFGTKTSDNLTEGSTNLYFTTARFTTQLGTKTTTNLAEGTNLYFTTARAKSAAVANSITGGVTDVAPSQDAVFTALAGKLAIANNLSDLASVTTARVNLRVDARTSVADADYTVVTNDRYVAYSSLSAIRTVTLPLASGISNGKEVIVADESGSAGLSTYINIVASGADTINGLTSVQIKAPYGTRRFTTNTLGKWSFDGGVLRSSNNLSDLQSTATAKTNLGLATIATTGNYSDLIGVPATTGISRQIISISTNTTAAATASTDYIYLVTGSPTLTLPTAVGNKNIYTVTNVGVGTPIVAFTSGQTGNGSSTVPLTRAGMSLDFVSDNSNFMIE